MTDDRKRRLELEHGARDKSVGMTLNEYERFAEAARRAGATGAEKVNVLVNFRRGVKSLKVTIEDPYGLDARRAADAAGGNDASGVRRGL